MKKKVLIAVVSFISLFFCAFLFSSSEAEAEIVKVTNCPNGCYAGQHRCFCFSWQNNEEDAKTKGDTNLEEVVNIDIDIPM